MREIAEVLERHGAPATRGGPAALAAREWVEAGFTDAEEVEDWLRARCFTAAGAASLEAAGLTPEQAAILTREGSGDYEDTLGFKVASGDLGLDEARRIATREFWDT